MARKDKNNEPQLDMFPVDPEIRGLAISKFQIKNGTIEADVTGSTLTGDAAMITDHVWRKALAEWLVNLCGNGDNVQTYIDEARARAHERERELELIQAAMSGRGNVTNFPSSGVALA